MHYICLLGFTFLLQHAQGSWLEDRMDSLTSPLLKPINDLNFELQASVAELEAKQEELEKQKLYLSSKLQNAPKRCLTENLLSHAKLHSQWDLEGCLNLTGDWKDGILFSLEFAIYAVNVTTEVWATVNTGMNCSALSFFKVLPCYYETFINLKDQVSYLKDKMAPLVKEGKQILLNMKKDFDYCFGIPQSLQYRIERNLGNCVENGLRRHQQEPQRFSDEDLF